MFSRVVFEVKSRNAVRALLLHLRLISLIGRHDTRIWRSLVFHVFGAVSYFTEGVVLSFDERRPLAKVVHR